MLRPLTIVTTLHPSRKDSPVLPCLLHKPIVELDVLRQLHRFDCTRNTATATLRSGFRPILGAERSAALNLTTHNIALFYFFSYFGVRSATPVCGAQRYIAALIATKHLKNLK